MVVETDKQSSFDSRAGSRVTPSNPFIKFSRNDIEQSIASRFQQIVDRDHSHVDGTFYEERINGFPAD